MTAFAEFVSPTLARKFVSLMVADNAAARLRVFCENAGFDLTHDFDGNLQSPADFDFHVTVFSSNNFPNCELPNGDYSLAELFGVSSIYLSPLGYEFLGPEKNTPVLLITPTNDLMQIRDAFHYQFGLTDDYPTWKPHITLSYNDKNHPPINRVRLPTFPISVDRLHIEDQKG